MSIDFSSMTDVCVSYAFLITINVLFIYLSGFGLRCELSKFSNRVIHERPKACNGVLKDYMKWKDGSLAFFDFFFRVQAKR